MAAFSGLSPTPSGFMNGLLGIHMTPPERAVVPPTKPVFSRMRTLLPAAFITSPAHMEPPPLPTTTKSKNSSNALIFPPCALRHALLIRHLPIGWHGNRLPPIMVHAMRLDSPARRPPRSCLNG